MAGYGFLLVAICFEVAGTICMKMSDGFTHTIPSILTYTFYGVCFWALATALKTIEVSTAYAIWSGVGTAIIATIGIVVFKEHISVLKIISLLMIIGGVVGLQLTSQAHG